jgi:hypothetical protein
LVIDIQWAGTYAASPFTVSYDWANNAMIITAKTASGASYSLSTATLDWWAWSTPLSTITSVQAPVDLVAQVSTITIGWVIETGDIFSADVSWVGDIVSYTAASWATALDIVNGLNTSITWYAWYAALPYTTSTWATTITLTAKTPGTGFTASSSTTNRAAVALIERVTIGWVVEAWDKYEIYFPNASWATMTGTYTAIGGNTTSDVAVWLRASIDAILWSGSYDFTTSISTNTIDLTAAVAGTPFTINSVSAINLPAVAQVSTITIGWVIETGDIFSVTMPSSTVISYTAWSGDTATLVWSWLKALIIADAGYAGESVTTTNSGAVISLTAKNAGTSFTASASVTNRPAVAQIDTFTITSPTSWDTVIIEINGFTYSYVIQTWNTATDVVSGLKTIINADWALPVTATGTSTLILTADVAGTSFVSTWSVITTWTVDKTITLKSGWNVLSTPQVLSSIAFSNGTAVGLSFYKLEGWVWAGTTIVPNTTNIKPLEGFLVYNSNAGEIQTYLTYSTGLTPVQKIFQKSLSSGWNVLGVTTTTSPYSTIGSTATSSVDFTDGTTNLYNVSTTGFLTTNWNASVANVQLWEAYWVFMSANWIYGGSQ